VRLSDEEKQILDGRKGEARRLALAVIVELGELFGAEELMAVSQVHIDTTVYMVDSGVEFAEKCAELGGRFSVPTSLNASAIDHFRWKEYRVPPDLLEKCRRLEKAYLTMGASPTWTCAPYQQGMIPRFGQQIAWGESNAIAFANSIIGARTNRYGDLMDICAGIVGRVPRFGLHLTENRKAEVLINLEDFSAQAFEDDSLYPLLGFLLGELAGDRVAALLGIPADVNVDALKGLSAAAASSGAVGLFHVVGVTPEAQNLEMCLQGKKLKEKMVITPKMVQAAEQRLWTAKSEQVDMVTVGCPHFSFEEFIELGRLIAGKRVHGSVAFFAYTSRAVYGWLENCGLLKTLTDAGLLVLTDGCPLQYPKKTWRFSAAFSNSAKFVNYCYSQTGLPVGYGSLADCVESAVSGRICRRKPPWYRS
jgi:predicted aconitase